MDEQQVDQRSREEYWRWQAERSLSRRELLALAAVSGSVLTGVVRPGRAAAQSPAPIVKPLPPEWFIRLGTNAEMRWEARRDQGYTVANERFFVRNHTVTPRIDPDTYRLQLAGSGLRRPRAFSLAELHALPSRELTAFIECAGNGRSFFGSQQGTPAAGSAWKLGATSGDPCRSARRSATRCSPTR